MSETGDSGGGDGGSSDAGAEASAEASAGSESGQPAAEAGETGPTEADDDNYGEGKYAEDKYGEDEVHFEDGEEEDGEEAKQQEASGGSGTRADVTEPGESEPVQAGQGENNPQPQDSNAGDGAISESVGDGQQAEPADQDPAGPDASLAGAEASAEASAGSEGGQPAAEAGESGPAEAGSAEAPDATDGQPGNSQPGNSAADSGTGTDAGVESSAETSDGSGAGADDTEPGENEPVQAGQGENVSQPQDTNVGDGVRSDGSGNNPNPTETFNEAAGVAGNDALPGTDGSEVPESVRDLDRGDLTDEFNEAAGVAGNDALPEGDGEEEDDNGTDTDIGVESAAETSDASGAGAEDTEPGESEPLQAGQVGSVPQSQDGNAGDGVISESVGNGQQAELVGQDPASPNASQAEVAELAAASGGEAPGGEPSREARKATSGSLSAAEPGENGPIISEVPGPGRLEVPAPGELGHADPELAGPGPGRPEAVGAPEIMLADGPVAAGPGTATTATHDAGVPIPEDDSESDAAPVDQQIEERIEELKNDGPGAHGPQRHLEVSDSQLKQRLGTTPALNPDGTPQLTKEGFVKTTGKIDPMTSTTTDAITGKQHKCGPFATRFNSPADYAHAESVLRANIDGKGDGIKKIEDLLGPDGHSRMTGYYIDPANPGSYHPVNFKGGSIKVIYGYDLSGKPYLYTMYPEPAPGTHP